ncbi:MAG: phytoene/squalene synthase family protein [Candidatus Brocadiae bacterium]|nr:phytoene/squalene synthase family protein [Candidatus Brocadiia bacterium]
MPRPETGRPPAAIPVEEAYVWCEALTRRAARNFWLPIRGLDPARRNAMCALYAFSRGADDIADEPGIADREERFADCRRRLDGAFSGAPDDETFTALADAARRFGIPREPLGEIIDGAEQDLRVSRYATFAELKSYCHKVAGAVGIACVHIFGFRDPAALEHADTLGLGMQLTNILRDLGEDARRGRVYLPEEELSRFGVTGDDLLAGRVTPEFRALMAFQVARAREAFARSQALFPLLDRSARFCPLAIRAVYAGLLDVIEGRGYDVFSRRASLSAFGKLTRLAGAWFRARFA